MANIFQKIFLSDKKIAEINQQQEILRLIDSGIVLHNAKIKLNGALVRRFYTALNDCNFLASRTYEPSLPEEHQIKYSIIYQENRVIKYATNSDIDKFAKKAYTKMYKAWEKSKQNVK